MTYYSDNADTLIGTYNEVDSNKLHKDWIEFLPEPAGVACDIGAGTGRDARWLAEKGWQVVAVEPERRFRESGESNAHQNVVWLNDQLPELAALLETKKKFDLVLLSAVWMHLPTAQRQIAFANLCALLKGDGRLVISLRHSSSDEELKQRTHYPVSVEEIERFAENQKVSVMSVSSRPDMQGRDYVSWETVVLSANTPDSE